MRILVATDFSSSGDMSVRGSEVAQSENAEQFVVYFELGNVLPHGDDHVADSVELQIHRRLELLASDWSEHVYRRLPLYGNLPVEIRNVATGEPVGLIVIGRHFQTGFSSGAKVTVAARAQCTLTMVSL